MEITDIKIPFWRLVVIFVKWTIAAIPATIILVLLAWLVAAFAALHGSCLVLGGRWTGRTPSPAPSERATAT